jgi:flagellar motor switch protein FliM
VLLTGPQLLLRDLIDLEPGDVLGLEYPVTRALDLLLSGSVKYRGEIVNRGNRVAFNVLEKSRTRWYEAAS